PLFVEAATRHRVFAVDLPGFGGSTTSSNNYSITAFVRTLRQFAAGVEQEQFHLVCHSLGGQVCLALSLDHPKLVKSLTLIDAAGTYNQEEFIQRMTRTRAGISLGDIRIARNAGFEMLLGGNLAILKRILGHDPFILSALASFKSSYRSRVRDLQVPTLIIWGIDDPLFPADYGFYLKENIEGSFLRLIPNAGHTPQLSDPDLIEELVSDFHNNIPVRKE
ncbi:alpha/beta hydrolase, partial [Myxococcota bacterium]|nr:alpha/beta hydrolase [Myxococcota bacterium]